MKSNQQRMKRVKFDTPGGCHLQRLHRHALLLTISSFLPSGPEPRSRLEKEKEKEKQQRHCGTYWEPLGHSWKLRLCKDESIRARKLKKDRKKMHPKAMKNVA